jgi:putative copper resistance protein D
MLFLADFLDTLLRGVVLAGVALALGGLAWALWALRPWTRQAPDALVTRALMLVAIGAGATAVGQAVLLALKALVLSDSFGRVALEGFAATLHFMAGTARILVALCLAAAALWLRRAVHDGLRWITVIALAVLLAATGAWLTHATGRLQDRAALMTLTALHQVAASVWVGGLAQLAGAWWLARRQPAIDAVWPALVRRFSALATTSVAVLIATAIPLTWTYAGSWRGLLGTGYGALVVSKTMLMLAALALGALNWKAVRSPTVPGAGGIIRTRLPLLVEAEAILLVMILFTAATLSGQPPSIDVAAADQATVNEVAEVFRPKLPSLHTPSVDAMRQDRGVGDDAPGGRSRDAYRWSNFSHNVSGLILLAMSLVALGGSLARPNGGRHWPLGFVALAAFVYLRAAANKGSWPFGDIPLWRIGPEGVQHALAAMLVLGLGLIEWRARARPDRARLSSRVFPALAAAGAVLLLTHSHTAFQTKASFLVQVTHTTMGALAALLVAARWLELRLTPPATRVAGAAASAAMLIIALILVFYREANILVPPD